MSRGPSGAARNSQRFIVAGGGIGGLACALALAQRGFRVLVCEQAPMFGQIGAGLQVAPNALSVLDALGVGARVKRQALLIERMLMMDGLSGEPVLDIPCDAAFEMAFGNPYAVAHRADVHGALLDGCRERSDLVELKTDARVASYVQDAASREVTVTLDNGERFTGGALIAADGIRSRVREQLLGDGEPHEVGALIYRALLPASSMPAALKQPYPTMWAGPGAHVIYYPVRGWEEFNLGITVTRAAPNVSEGVAEPAEALEGFDAWHSSPLSVIRAATRFQRYVIRHREPVVNWCDGVVTLLGDAAHPMVQYIAQGAAMALEDAVCLADCIDASDGDVVRALVEYQDLRIARTARVQISSLMLGRLYHAQGVERTVRNAMLGERDAAESNIRLAWLFTPPAFVTRFALNKTR